MNLDHLKNVKYVRKTTIIKMSVYLTQMRIKEIKISKKHRARTIDRPSGEEKAEDLIQAQEAWEIENRKKKKKRRR